MTLANAIPPTDEELAARGTNVAVQVLYDRYAPALLAFLAAQAPSADFEDLHHDVWLSVWKYLSTFRAGNFRAWVFQIARNRLNDNRRKKRPDRLSADADPVDPRDLGSPVPTALERERRQVLEACLKKLARHDEVAAALVRGRLAGEGYTELCPRLGLKESGAYKCWHEAVKRLQDCVERAIR